MHHVVGRGIDGRKTFLSEGDMADLLDRIGRTLLETKTNGYAWALPLITQWWRQRGLVMRAESLRVIKFLDELGRL